MNKKLHLVSTVMTKRDKNNPLHARDAIKHLVLWIKANDEQRARDMAIESTESKYPDYKVFSTHTFNLRRTIKNLKRGNK